MKKFILIFIFVLTIFAFSKEKKYVYTLKPLPSPLAYINNGKVVIASKNIVITAKQVNAPVFSNQFPAFKQEPNTTFIYIEFSVKNRTKNNVHLDINFISLESNKEFKKPLNYDQMYSMIKKIYPQANAEPILQKYLLDYISPIKPNEKKTGVLIFRNFREKAKNAVLKIDNITVDNMPLGLKIPYNLERRKVIIE